MLPILLRLFLCAHYDGGRLTRLQVQMKHLAADQHSRHWPVFLAGLVMVFVFWGLTPITGAIFNADVMTRNILTDVVPCSQIVPLSEQLSRLDGNVFNEAYSIPWRNMSLPPFTTRDSAFLSFNFSQDMSAVDPGNGTLTAPTTRYFTNITCTAGSLTDSSGCVSSGDPHTDTLSSPHYVVENGQGCKVPIPVYTTQLNSNTTTLDYGSLMDANGTYLGCPCNQSSSNMFYINLQPPVTGDAPPKPTRSVYIIGEPASSAVAVLPTFSPSANYMNEISSAATNLFCSSSYWEQKVNATVSIREQSVVGMVALEDPTPLSPALFNTTNFEYALNVGPISFDIPMIDNRFVLPTTKPVPFEKTVHNPSNMTPGYSVLLMLISSIRL